MSKGPSWPHSLVGEGETELNMKETKQAVMKQKKEACPRQGTESLGRASVAGTHEGPVEAGWREDWVPREITSRPQQARGLLSPSL